MLSPRIVPLGLAVLAIAVPLIGSGFSVLGLAAVWALVTCLVIVALIIGRPSPQIRVFAGLAALPMLFLLAYEGGWWFIPAVLADMVISARMARDQSLNPARTRAGPRAVSILNAHASSPLLAPPQPEPDKHRDRIVRDRPERPT